MISPSVNVYKVHMAYFFREKSEIRAFELTSSLYNQFKDVFKTEPQSLSVPNDTPDEIPRCIWDDVNKNMTFSKLRLDLIFYIPNKFTWESLLQEFNKKIMSAIIEAEIVIDRVGLVVEVMSHDNLHDLLKESIQINNFNVAKEANISWLENMDSYNVWTYLIINETEDINKIMFDVNSLPEYKLGEQGISALDAMNKCAELLKRKMVNVL